MAATGETERLVPLVGPSCPKCAGSMETGFVPDLAHANQIHLPIWVSGQPEAGFWSGYRINDRQRYYLEANRCQRCGYVEFYARRSVEGSHP